MTQTISGTQSKLKDLNKLLKLDPSKRGISIGDRDMQIDCFCDLLKEQYANVWYTLGNAASVRQASDAVLLKFERPADQSERVQAYRAGLGQKWFDQFAGTEPQKKEESACDPQKVIAVAIAELGYLEKAGNAQLDDKTANAGSGNFTKYARDIDVNYPRFYNGAKNGYAWCDVFLDWCFITAYGYENALKLLCQPEGSCGAGCTFSMQYYQNKGRFHRSNPQPGDQIFFGNSTESTHTGLVEKVEGGAVITIECNTSDRVARRSYSLSDGSILGYGRPAYDSISGQGGSAPTIVLIRNGYACGGRVVNGNEIPDGDFGSSTDKAVRAFQKLKGLSIDGVIGKDTWTALLTT